MPFNRKRFLVTYRWFWDYSGGYITDFGTHRLDTVQQVMGVNAPKTVAASGGRFSLRDDGEIPDVLQVTYEYPGFVMSYETCLLNGHGVGGRTPNMKYYNAKGAEDRPNGMAFYGTNGALYADRIGYEIYPEPQEPARTQADEHHRRHASARREFHRLRAFAKHAQCGCRDRPPVHHGRASRQHRVQDRQEAALELRDRRVRG